MKIEASRTIIEEAITLLNQKLTQWEIYHLLQLMNYHSILFDIPVHLVKLFPFIPIHLVKLFFLLICDLPTDSNWDRNKWDTCTRTSPWSQANSCSPVDEGNYNSNEYDWCSLTRKLRSEKIFAFCLNVQTNWLPNESHTNVPHPIIRRNNNSTRSYQIKALSQSWSNLKELKCPRATYLFLHKNTGRHNKPICNTCPG